MATKELTEFASVTGESVTGKVDGSTVALGNSRPC